jgi:UDP-N-acetylglucosamine 2-epimerase (non-hydrolysing)
MLDQVMRIFDMRADIDLDLMQPGQDLYDITSRVLLGMREVLKREKPDLMLVHGDTTTCFAAGLAAFYQGIPVGHVEAGLRTGNLLAPFPEEANRSLVGRIAEMHFAPTDRARKNLLAENIAAGKIVVTGNTVIDALLIARDKVKKIPASAWSQIIGSVLCNRIRQRSGRFVLITGHRRENFGQGFVDLCNAIRELALMHPDWLLLYPVHLNPNVQKPVQEILSGLPNVHLIEPLEYLPFVWLMDQCDLILTDSGGIQEEGPALGKPVLVMREVTERPEAIDAGTVKLVGTDKQRIVDAVELLLRDEHAYRTMVNATNPFGDGTAAQQIVAAIKQRFAIGNSRLQKVSV